MKKYLINGKFLLQRITGVQRFAIEILKELDKVAEEGQFSILVPAKLNLDLKLQKVKVLRLGRGSRGILWTQLVFPLFALRKGCVPLTFCGLFPVIYPGVATIHDITPMRYKHSFKKSFYLGYDLIYRMGIKRLKHVFTVSEFSKREISDYYNVPLEKISVVYNASNFSIDNSVEPIILNKFGLKKDNYILSVGSLHIHKNPQFMFELARKYPKIPFVLVGGTTEKTFESIDKECLSNLVYTGYLSDEELLEIYANANGFVFPSLYEGFGIPALEAIQAGVKHVAVSDIPVFREVYNVGVYRFNPCDVDTFDMDAFLNTELTTEQREVYMRKYSWSNSAKEVINEL